MNTFTAGLPLFSRASKDAFDKFHAENPDVWRHFEKFTLELIEAGHLHYSADAVCHRIRWHLDVETKSEDGLKLNNNYTAHYARLFAARYPQHATFFRCRRRKSPTD